ncbi:ribonuclease J [Hydrogenimonas sp.]|uniref:ribonuclease J n=1 Tax=Hydrogenimonas sp. TaxID=2231112 RepID=UPI002618CC27|nr:ribonuclease J [Hydrogenimonas sp.]
MEEKKPQGNNPSGNNKSDQRSGGSNNPNNQSRSRRPRRPRSGGQQQGEKRQEQQKNTSQGGGQNRPRGGSQRGGQRGRGGQKGRGRGNGRNPESHYKTPSNVQRSSDGIYTDINQAIAANKAVQEERIKTANKIDVNNKARVRFTPLGGLGEIGGNMAVLETENSAILIDVGMSFPTEEMHGVDILVPDFSYLHAIKEKIDGIVITHAHEDHIGAVPYLFKELKFPIYGTPLPLGMIANKFDEHGLKNDKQKYFRYVEKRKPIKIGDFEIEWLHMTHSIIDASSLAIRTPAGIIFHTGDFKIDHTPVDGYPADLHRIAQYGEEGVLCLLSDSTNSHKAGITRSEKTVGPTFDHLFAKAKGRVIMSTFSSNIHRVYQAIEHGLKYGRKVAVIGRSMERNLETARQLGYIDLPEDIFIDAHEVVRYSDNEVLIVTTGSQGEPMSALYRMATDEHRHIKIKPSDTIIISAKAIPGNEGSVSRVMNHLMRAGATVAYQDFSEIHVSGHAAQEEQKLMLRLTQPKFFLPVHGEYNHIARHAKTAVQCGVDERNILLMSDGDQVEITTKYMKKVKTVKTGKTYIDNQANAEIQNDIVLDRQKLATEGIIMIVAQIDQRNHKLVGHPRVSTFGLVADKDDKRFAKEVEAIIETYMVHQKDADQLDTRTIENDIRQAVRKHVLRKMKRYPLIVPTVYVV